MDDPVAGGLLSDTLLHKRLLGSEKLHGELVVGWLEEGLQLVLDETLFAGFGGAQRCWSGLLFGGAV